MTAHNLSKFCYRIRSCLCDTVSQTKGVGGKIQEDPTNVVIQDNKCFSLIFDTVEVEALQYGIAFFNRCRLVFLG